MDDAPCASTKPPNTGLAIQGASDPRELAAQLRTPLTPVVGLLEVFLRRWRDELTPSQIGLLSTVDRESRRILVRLDEVVGAPADVPALLAPGSSAAGADEGGVRPSGETQGDSGELTLADQVVQAVADLLRARDADQMLATLRRLVEGCGGAVGDDRRDALATMRVLPDDFRVPHGREMTLGPVLRALSAAAVERASGELEPTRRAGAATLASVEGRESLVALDLCALGSVRSEFGDPGARWLVDKLHRTLRSLLRTQDSALRYPATRFLLVLGGTGPSQAEQFARRIAWEWDTYLGRDLRVLTQVEPIDDGDLAASLRRLACEPEVR
jgi:hypothetical protein